MTANMTLEPLLATADLRAGLRRFLCGTKKNREDRGAYPFTAADVKVSRR
jgi:hypothetical protein